MSLSHADKDALIKELKDKLKEMKKVEEQVSTSASELSVPGFGVVKENDRFVLVKLSYDLEKNAAAISEKVDLGRDYSVALFKAKEYLVLNILKGGKL